MVGRPAKSRHASARAPQRTSARNVGDGVAARKGAKVSVKQKAFLPTANRGEGSRGATLLSPETQQSDIEVIEDDAESIRSAEERQESSGVSDAEGGVNVVIVDLQSPELAASSVQPSPASHEALAWRNNPQPTRVTCVSDSDTDEGNEEASVRRKLHTSSPSARYGALVACLSSDDSGDTDGSEDDAQNSCQRRRARDLLRGASNATQGSASCTDLSSSTAASMVGVSSFTAYFTYGIQAAMQHYADHFFPEDDCVDDSGDRSAAMSAHYHNSFLAERRQRAELEGIASLVNAASRSSSVATYDSDAEASPYAPLSAVSEKMEHLLEPQGTSLYRAPPSSAVSRSAAGASWSCAGAPSAATATAASPPSPATRHRSKAPLSDVFPSREAEWTSGDALACFREALRRAYACEDAVRQRRRSEVGCQHDQLLRTLAQWKSNGDAGDRNAAAKKVPRSTTVKNGTSGASTSRSSFVLATGDSSTPAPDSASSAAPSTLSNLADYAMETEDVRGTASSPHAKANGKKAANKQRQRETATSFFAVEEKPTTSASISENKNSASLSPLHTTRMGAVASVAAASSQHILQLVHPSQLYKLHRAPSVLVETLLKHHREAQQKQRAAQHAEDQAVHIRRLYELPILTEDIVRYAMLLLCLKRPDRRSAAHAREVANQAGSGARLNSGGSDHGTPQSPSNTTDFPSLPQRSSPSPTAITTDTSTAAIDGADSMPPYGEDGSLLYLKYPAPLLRTTSFAVETVRLLKWLRTWRNSGIVLGSPSASTISAKRENAGGMSQRKRAKVETAIEATASSTSKTEAAPTSRSAVEEVHQQLQQAQQVAKAQAKQQKRSAFLKFFGAAVAPSSAAEEAGEVKKAELTSLKAEGSDGLNVIASSSANSFTTVSRLPPSSQQRRSAKNEEEELRVVQQPQPQLPASPHLCSPTALSDTASPLTAVHPAVYAYQLYSYAWKHAVKTGITPLATAAQAFAGSRNALMPGASPTPSCAEGRAARTADGASTAEPGVPRVCAALPFYKEMREEARRTALGSATRGAYYEDAYGNRLRSARLAQKEQEKQEQLEAQQRRRAKKKGYFHRDNTEEGAAGRSAAAMLEAMLFPSVGEVPGDDDSANSRGRRKKASSATKHDGRCRRQRTPDSEDVLSSSSSSSASASDDEVVVTSPQTTKRDERGKRTHPPASDSLSSGQGGFSDSSSDGEGVDDDAADARDEITNIAVVSGPTGAGKTAAVYVAAQLLGFRVVEMNASVRRCSKTVEHLLAELTRSYRLSGLRPGSPAFNAEEELTKLKQQHAAMMERAKAEAEAAEREAENKRKEARKANGISAQAVANFFAKSSTSKAGETTGGKAAKRQRVSTNVDDIGDDDDAVVQVPPPAISPLAPPPPPDNSTNTATAAASPAPTQTPAASPVGIRTLLLFEDADILLGDESAKPFYAAIRDLAHRSKVPIVVTVSADTSTSQRYDTPHLSLASAAPSVHSIKGAPSGLPSLSTYWQLCEEAGLNSRMDSLEASHRALQASPVLGDRAAAAAVNENGTGSSGGGGGASVADSTNGYSGGTSPSHSGNTASSVLSFFSPTRLATGASAGAGGSVNSSAGVSSPPPPLPSAAAAGGGGGASASAGASFSTQLASRYTHILLNASLVSSFFGTQTPFTVVDALPTSALFVQLLAVGAVELNLLQWKPTLSSSTSPWSGSTHDAPDVTAQAFPRSPLPTGSSPHQQQQLHLSKMPSSASWQHDMDHLTGSLTLRDPALFFELAEHLCHALFGDPMETRGCEASSRADEATKEAQQWLKSTLTSAILCDAAGRTTTDIRYWLNRLQMLLLRLQSRETQKHSAEVATCPPNENTAADNKNPREVRKGEVDSECSEKRKVTGGSVTVTPRCRNAERLVEKEFRQYTSFAASEWDRALGQYMTHLTHNEVHSSRYEYWVLDDHVDYVSDIVGELNAQDHPTLHIDYTRTPGAKPSTSIPAAAAAVAPGAARRGRPPAASSNKGAKSTTTASAVSGSATQAVEQASDRKSSTPAGSLNPPWKALFGGASPSSTTTAIAAPHMLSSAAAPSASSPPTRGGQQTLFGLPRGPTTPEFTAPPIGAVLDVPARCEWPPSGQELRRQVNSSTSRLRPVEVLLPYSTAQAYYDSAATSVSASVLRRCPDVADPSPLLLGHDTALRFVNRQGGREMVDEDGDCADVTSELPSSVHVTQEERSAVLRRWWRRTRKVGALRDYVAGRSAAALEDVLGHSCLLAPSTAAASGSNGNI